MSTISAGTTTTTGYVVTSDTTGALVLKTGASGTTAVTVGSDQSVTFAGSQTFSGGTANGVLYLNGSKVATSGSALTFDGTDLQVANGGIYAANGTGSNLSIGFKQSSAVKFRLRYDIAGDSLSLVDGSGNFCQTWAQGNTFTSFGIGGSEQMRLTSTGLGIGTSSPSQKLEVAGSVLLNPTNPALAFNTLAYQVYKQGTSLRLYANSIDHLVCDGSGNVGIGTSSPATKFQVNSTAPAIRIQETTTGGDKRLELGVTSGGQAYIGANQSAQSLQFQTVGATQMTLDASGRLGIGQTSPAYKLDIRNDVPASTSLDPTTIYMYNNSDGGSGIQFLNGVGGKSKISFGVESTGSGTDDTYIGFSTSVNAGALTERARIDSSGNFSLGFAGSPYNSAKMEIYRASGGDALILTSPVGTGNQNAIAWSNSRGDVVSARIYNADDGAYGASIVFANRTGQGTTTTERMRIDTAGNLLVGRTSTINNFKLVVGGTDAQLGLDGVSAYAQINYSMNGVYKAQTYYAVSGDRFVTQCGSTGGVYLSNGATSWTALSDERTKDIIEPIVGGISKLANLRTVIGKYKTDAEGTRRSFLIAQDVLNSFPEAVDTSDPDEMGVRYQDLTPVLVAAIKEQQALIESLTQRIAALEGQ